MWKIESGKGCPPSQQLNKSEDNLHGESQMIYKNWTDKSFGQIILVISVVIAFVLAIWFNIIGEPIPFSVMAWPAVGLLVGFAFIFGTALAKSINVSLEELPELLEDDLDALRKGQITTEHLYTAATAASMIAEVYLLGYYHKWMATWGSINVLFVALLVVLVALWYMLRSAWFQDRSYRLHHRFYVISAMGWLICIFLGAYCAEPIGFGRLSPTEQSQLAGSDN